MNPLTLSFRDRSHEAEFLLDHASRSLSIVRISLIFAALLYVVYTLMDHRLVPDRAFLLLLFRSTGTVFLLLIALFSILPAAKKYFQVTMTATLLVAGTGVVTIVLVVEEAGWHNYYGGVILALIYAHALMRLRFVYATLASWALVGLYIVAGVRVAGLPGEVIINNSFHLVSANMLGMFASYGLEYYARTVFLKTRMLDESRKSLAREYERTTNELAAVREIQFSMLPQELPAHPAVEVGVMMSTAAEVGGDYYDFLTAEDGSLVFAIGDATGHGARAGAMVTASKLLFSIYAVKDGPERFLERASSALRRMRFRNMYMAMAVGLVTGTRLEIVGAGMPPGILFRSVSGTIEPVHLKGVPLGSNFDVRYAAQSIALAGGDVLVLMSDGFPELFNESNAMLGRERMERAVLAAAPRSSSEIVTALCRLAADWRGSEPLRDDLTLMVLKVKRHRDVVDAA